MPKLSTKRERTHQVKCRWRLVELVPSHVADHKSHVVVPHKERRRGDKKVEPRHGYWNGTANPTEPPSGATRRHRTYAHTLPAKHRAPAVFRERDTCG